MLKNSTPTQWWIDMKKVWNVIKDYWQFIAGAFSVILAIFFIGSVNKRRGLKDSFKHNLEQVRHNMKMKELEKDGEDIEKELSKLKEEEAELLRKLDALEKVSDDEIEQLSVDELEDFFKSRGL